jgi:hypothetical protein
VSDSIVGIDVSKETLDAEAPAKALEDVLLQRCAPGHIRVIEAQ